MAGLGRKVFTAGDVLTASDVQNYLMDQSVMNFAGTAARSSAIATPTTGMTTYIGVTGTATIPQIEVYTGADWQTPYGITQVGNVSFTTAATVSLNNVFTSTYSAYRVVIQALGSSAGALAMRYRTGGVDESGAVYNYETLIGTNAVASATITNTQTSQNIGAVRALRQSYELNIYDPALATSATTYTAIINDYQSASSLQFIGGWFTTLKAVDGFTLIPAVGTITGTVRVYGYRNS